MLNIATIGQQTPLAQQDNVIIQYTPLVKRIAHTVLTHLPDTIQRDDLLQAGMLGLLEAAKRYDPKKGASFETYAAIRIRGRMLDEVRKENWLPRSVHRNLRRVAVVTRHLENHLGRDARDHEIAAAMHISLKKYNDIIRASRATQCFTLDELMSYEVAANANVLAPENDPLEGLQLENFCRVLAKIIENLPERERLVLSLYYDKELSLKKIGAVLHVSESRVCQIHSHAMLRLQAYISDWHKS